MRETYAITILEHKAERLRRGTGNKGFRSALEDTQPAFVKFKIAIMRPCNMLIKSPILMSTCLIAGIYYGYLYLFFTTFPIIFEGHYGFSTGSSGLVYIGNGVGYIVSLFLFSMTSGRLVQSQVAKGQYRPEDRLPLMILGGLLLPIGLFWYGWTAQAHTHWIMPIIGTAIASAGILLVFMPIIAYLIDAFTIYAAR